MAIAYFGGGEWGGTANSATVTYTLPASIPVGALIWLFRETGTTQPTQAPAGYTFLRQWPDANVEAMACWKESDGTEATFNQTIGASERSASLCMVFTGVDMAAPFIVENQAVQAGTSTTIVTATVNNTNPAAWRISAFGYRTSTATDTHNWWTADLDVEKFDVACTSNSNDPRIACYSSDAVVATGNTAVTGTSISTSDAVAWIGILSPKVEANAKDLVVDFSALHTAASW